MKTDGTLTSREKEILDEGNRIVGELCREINESVIAIPKKDFVVTPMGKMPAVMFLEKFRHLANEGNERYKKLKAELDEEKSTHEFITEKAVEYIRPTPINEQVLIPASKEPDKNWDLYAIAFEGHFFGAIPGGGTGNYFHRVIKQQDMFDLLNWSFHIDEHAVENFTRYISECKSKKGMRVFGWALHFIQDMTEPHHATNRAIFFEQTTDNNSSHHEFEGYANAFVLDKKNSDSLMQRVEPVFDEFYPLFNPADPVSFARKIHSRALEAVEDFDMDNEGDWDKLILANIPLAIGASAVLLKHLAE